MNRALLLVGVVLIVLGIGLLTGVLRRRPALDDTTHVPLVGEYQGAQNNVPSAVWPLAAGLSLAAGAGCIGLGMNRWWSQGSR